ncbi:hypothetical protein [Vreelandella utahensis]|uniref:hypothetical protein n=1 Tax=Vreelandella halophila TaxID=86177 RepID=UPI000985F28F|nr:hypothetical protein [Halomonas utahensis]
MESIHDRAKLLINLAGIDTLVRSGVISSSRWKNILYKDVRLSTEEMEVLKEVYPNHIYWLMTGEVIPEAGQTSPET